MDSINFLKDKAAALQKKSKVIFWLNLSSFVFLGLYIVVLTGIFSYQLVLKKQAVALENSFNKSLQEVKDLSDVETKQIYLKNKLGSLQQILADQRQNQQITEAVFNLVPEGIGISGFAIDQEGGVSFSASSRSFKVLKDFLTSLETTTNVGDLAFSQINVKRVGFNFEQGYSLNLYISFK
jgi:Tfp pilus assembly protein PilN